MADLAYYAAKIAECLRLREGSSDQLYRDVYQAMADEFAEKYAILARRIAEATGVDAPPSSMLGRGPPLRPSVVRTGAPPDGPAAIAPTTGGLPRTGGETIGGRTISEQTSDARDRRR